MALTQTEQLIQELNYNLISRMSSGGATNYTNTTYPSAIKGITSIFVKQAEQGTKTIEEIQDFGDYLSLVNYLDNVNSYDGINQILNDYKSWIVQNSTIQTSKESEDIEQMYGRAI